MVISSMRLPSSMHGNVEDVNGCGYGETTLTTCMVSLNTKLMTIDII